MTVVIRVGLGIIALALAGYALSGAGLVALAGAVVVGVVAVWPRRFISRR